MDADKNDTQSGVVWRERINGFAHFGENVVARMRRRRVAKLDRCADSS